LKDGKIKEINIKPPQISNKIKVDQQKLSFGVCPKCNFFFPNETAYYGMMRCSKCENVYKWNYQLGIYENVLFISLQMPLEAHYEYDCLCLDYLSRHFPYFFDDDIKTMFSFYRHLLIPTVSHLKISPPLRRKKKKVNELPYNVNVSKNIFYLNDIHILDSKEETELYLIEFSQKEMSLPDSKLIVKCKTLKNKKIEELGFVNGFFSLFN
jgi:hypothetical protein